ncbi:hypothetical protein TgHK011_002773 [Trichoderma gracile]|nr:hypothetical protein TgHK011_002773 [Trichoderma gracile]
MPQSLRSILGKSNRVRKPSRPTTRARQNPSSPAKPPPSSPSPRKSKKKPAPKDDPDAQFQDKLSDIGVAQLLQEELTLRDVVQAMRYVRSKMFTPVPPTGFKSTRSAEILNYRLAMPPIVTLGHLHAVLTSPSKVEREVVELSRSGVIRKVRVERRGGMGEALIEMADFEAMVRKAGVSQETRDRFLEFLRENPTAQTVPRDAVTHAQTDELVRAGFLTSSLRATPGTTLHVRPEDRTTLTSIHHVSRFASGSVSAVGGQNALHLAGGSGGAPTLLTGGGSSSTQGASDGSSDFRIAVPGHGRYLKLAEGTVDWLRDMMDGTRWGEAPEDWFRERFEGGGLYGTRWKEFWGVEWEWVLGQAVGLGVVEVFETGSVGRGVRALGG